MKPEYTTMSNGIGADWYEKFKGDVFPHDRTPIVGENTIINGAPRYYTERLKAEDPELHEEIKRERDRFMQENSDEYTPERLKARYKIAQTKAQRLKRTLR